MGLDIVELVMEIEDTFGIRISNAEAPQIQSVGDLTRSVLQKLHPPEGSWFCESSRAFYKVRKALRLFLPLNWNEIRPESRLEELIPRMNRREVWQHLQAAGLGLPNLLLPIQAFIVSLAVVGGIAGLILIIQVGLLAEAAALLVIGELIFLSLIAFHLTRPLAIQIPDNARTIRSVVRVMTKGEHGSYAANERKQLERAVSWRSRDREEVARKVREVISENLGVPIEQLHDETRFVDDLGAD